MHTQIVPKRTLPAFFLTLVLCALPLWPALGQSFYIKPHLQNVTTDGATLIWETPEANVGEVEFGLPGALDKKAQDPAATKIHRVRLTGLQPETAYAYRVRAGADEASATFRTAPGSSRPTAFVVLGDSRRWDDRWQATNMAAHIERWKPEFYINNGDLVVRGHDYALWPEHFDRFSDISDRYMIVTARGNHEGSMYNDTENDWFAKYHELPGEGEPYSAFDWGNVHVVLISIEDIKNCASWLDQHLAGVDKNKWVLVVQHVPVYCAGYGSPDDSRKETGDNFPELAQVLDKHNVRMDMSGHTHIYERSYPMRAGKRDDRGGYYIVNGGDINSNYPEHWTAVRDDKRVQAKPTYSVFQTHDDRVDIRTFCWSTVENAIVPIDRIVIPKDESVAQAAVAALAGKQGAGLVAAIEEVGATMYAPAVDTLAPYLKDADPAVRRAAASALRAIGTEAASEALAPYLDDADLAVRREAARALEITLPQKLAKQARRAALDSAQDEDVRVALLGALQLHAPAKVTRKTSVAVLESDAPVAVRQRAAYALGRVADKSDARLLARLVQKEEDEYALVRLGWTLNNVTSGRVSLNDKGTFVHSKPGARDEYIQEWLGK